MVETVDLSTLASEVDNVIANGDSTPIGILSGTLHLLDINLDITAMKVFNYDVKRNYASNFMDSATVSVAFPSGTYADFIYPNKDNVEFTLYGRMGTPADSNLLSFDELNTVNEQRYKAKITSDVNPRITQNGQTQERTDSIDLTDFVTIEIQLIDFSGYLIRMTQVGTVLRNATVKDATQALLTEQCGLLKVTDDEKLIGIDIIQPDNQDIQSQIVIPQGTPLYQVPHFIQNNCQGMYSKGLGSYIQNRVWYIYPLNDADRDPTVDREIQIIIIPSGLVPTMEHSFRIFGTNKVIVCTGNATMLNAIDKNQLNQGSGKQFADATKPLTEEYPKRKDNKIKLGLDDIINSITGIMASGSKFNPLMKDTFTNNPYTQQSAVTSINGGNITCTWENSSPGLIVPGSLVKVLYLDAYFNIYELSGSIIEAQHSIRYITKGMAGNQYKVMTALNIWVEGEVLLNILKQAPSQPEADKKGEGYGGAVGWMSGDVSGSKSSTDSKNIFDNLTSIFGGHW